MTGEDQRGGLRGKGKAQLIYPATLARIHARADKLRADDPLHRKVTVDQALTWMLDKLDELDKQENQP